MIPNIPKIEHPERFPDFQIPREKLECALAEALKKIDAALPDFTDHSPAHASVNNVYAAEDNDKIGGWNQGFWTGELWHAYELTGKEIYKDVCVNHQVPTFLRRIETKFGVNHHDMGFLFTPSCVAAYKLTGDENAKRAALLAADHLITRYSETAKFIQAWGNVNDPKDFRLIIDCLLNIPLLYWASEVTGDKKYGEIAYNHFKTTVDVIYREDASSFHTYYFDRDTGAPVRGVTHQGAGDDTAWARGQAWGVYGPVLTYHYVNDDKALQACEAAFAYMMNHLPEDYIPYWDLSFTDGADEPRDSSSAPIAVCGILEAIKFMDDKDPNKKLFRNAANLMMNSLIDNYLTKDIPESNGLLLHATYSKPHKIGVDEMNIWGDYFYMEALHRMLDESWHLYW